MNYKTLLIKLYYILVYADGKINDSEVQSGNQLINTEAITHDEFSVQMQMLKSKDQATLFSECLSGLKRLVRDQQIRSVAWLCVIANADGFMDKAEWQLIYKIYHKELNLSLDEILVEQKQLSLIALRVPSAKAL